MLNILPTLAEIEEAQAAVDAMADSETLPSVDALLAGWCRVETAHFEAAESARKAEQAAPPAAPKPAANVVTIAGPRTSEQYKVTPFATSWGRGFTFQKINAKKPASYDVLIGVNGEPDCCDCGAATFSAHKPCKHVLACKKLVAAGGITVPTKPAKPAYVPRHTADQDRW